MRILTTPQGFIFVYRQEYAIRLGSIVGYRTLAPAQQTMFKQFLQKCLPAYIDLSHNRPVKVMAVSGQVPYLLVVFSGGTRLRVGLSFKWRPDQAD